MIDLSGDWEYIEHIADRRWNECRTPRHVFKYGPGIEILGAAGELAARRYFGMEEELEVGLDHGVDFSLYGHKIDVKATHWTPKIGFRYLQWPIAKPIKCEIILLMGVNLEGRKATPLGYAFASDIQRTEVNDSRYIKCYEIQSRKLRPVWELDNLLIFKNLPSTRTFDIINTKYVIQ